MDHEKKSDYAIPLLSITLIVILVIILIIYIIMDPESVNISRNNSVTNFLIECPVNYCSTDILTGVKTCPGEGESIVIDPRLHVCNSKYLCENTRTPYAVQANGSTSADGICPDNIICRCLTSPQCSNDTMSIFEISGGNAYQDLEGTNSSLEQVISYNDIVGKYITEPPYVINKDNEFKQFCSIPLEWMERTHPMVNLQDSECIRGVLSFIPGDSNNFDKNKAEFTPLSCMRGEVCPLINQTSVWDNKTRKNLCIELCPVSGCIDGTDSLCEMPIYNKEKRVLECIKYNI